MGAFFSRADIGYGFPRAGYTVSWPMAEIYLHHFDSGIQAPQTVEESLSRLINADRYHAVTQGWAGIGYSWAVDDLGNIFECRGWWQTGAHTWNHNSKGYGIVWLGDSYTSLPSPLAVEAFGSIVRKGVADGAVVPFPTIAAHRDRVPDTDCCGSPMYGMLDQFRQAAWYGTTPRPDPLGPVRPPTPPPTGDDDMTDEERTMLIQVHGVLGNAYPGWGRPPSINDILAIFSARFDDIDKRLGALEQRPSGGTVQGPSAADVAAEIIRQLR